MARTAWVVLMVAAVALAVASVAMADEPPAEGQGGGVDSEMLEQIFRAVSPPCQEEMQAALDDPSAEVSDSCKGEIKGAIEGSERMRQAQQARAGQQGQAKPKGPAPLIPPSLIVLFFVVLVFGGIGYYVYTENQRNPRTVRGPRSKKKEERDRRRNK